ncbi:Uncharacterised protein [uncultured archaeon]|nr:Uncharacterised protein [uncultured archaeon]
MGFPSEKLGALFLFSLLLISIVAADFSLSSLNVFINVNLDGSANVEEKLDLLINGTQSRDLYDTTRAAYSDLATWKDRTQLSEMRHHITRANADITNLRIVPQAVERCNSFLGVCHGVVVLDYVVPAGVNG